MPANQGALLTRAEAANFLSERGYKIKLGYLHRMSSLGTGPKPAVLWGERKRPLYSPDDILAWAQSRCSVPA
jgi:hypothetical protein